MPPHRLDAEQIRDQILVVTGELDRTAGGPSVESTQPRRSIYTKVFRNRQDPLLAVFDAADSFASVDRRNTTTTPNQALFLFNGPWPLARAQAMARRLEREAPDDGVIDRAYRLAYGRPVTAGERRAAEDFLRAQTALYEDASESVRAEFLSAMPGRDGNLALEISAKGARFAATDNPGSDHAAWPDEDFTIEAVIQLRIAVPGRHRYARSCRTGTTTSSTRDGRWA